MPKSIHNSSTDSFHDQSSNHDGDDSNELPPPGITDRTSNRRQYRPYASIKQSGGTGGKRSFFTGRRKTGGGKLSYRFSTTESDDQLPSRRFTVNLPQGDFWVAEPVGDKNELLERLDVGGDNTLLRELSPPSQHGEEERRRGYSTIGSIDLDSSVAVETGGGEQARSRSWSRMMVKDQLMSFIQPADNKLALKLFGSRVALASEKKRQREAGKYIIHPCSNFRLYWNLIMLILLGTNLIALPVLITFFRDSISAGWLAFNMTSDVIFIIDIILNFRTGIICNDFVDDIILNPGEIARHYLKTWFTVDLISSIPVDYIILLIKSLTVGDEDSSSSDQYVRASAALRILRLARLLSLLRLLRLSRLLRYASQWEEIVNIANKFMGICNLVLVILLIGHWNACLQFLVPKLMEFPVQSWVSKARIQNAHWFEQYTWSLFKALSHMLSIGFGRFPPTTLPEAWTTIFSMMVGATCYALFIGHAAALIQSFDASKRKYRDLLKQLEEYMSYKKLPRDLRERISSYFEHRYKGKMFNEQEILGELSECLREQIVNYNCRALVATAPLFASANQDFVSEVVVKLKEEVFQPGDLIIKQGTLGNKMYFIQDGVVDIITSEGEIATSLTDGCYFGEICLLANVKRVASVKADTYCRLYSLDRSCFQEVLENYPQMRRDMEPIATERLRRIGARPSIMTRDGDQQQVHSSSSSQLEDEEEGTNSDVNRRPTKERRSSTK